MYRLTCRRAQKHLPSVLYCLLPVRFGATDDLCGKKRSIFGAFRFPEFQIIVKCVCVCVCVCVSVCVCVCVRAYIYIYIYIYEEIERGMVEI